MSVNNISKIEESIFQNISKYEFYRFISDCIKFYQDKVFDKDLTKNRLLRLSYDGLTLYFLNSANILNIPMDWVCLSFKLKDSISYWEENNEMPFSQNFIELYFIVKFISLCLSKTEHSRKELQNNLENYINPIIQTEGNSVINWFHTNFEIILPPITFENLITTNDNETT